MSMAHALSAILLKASGLGIIEPILIMPSRLLESLLSAAAGLLQLLEFLLHLHALLLLALALFGHILELRV